MSEEDIARELEISWFSSAGLRIFPEFHYEIHVSTEPLDYDPEKPLALGWDFGLSPACVIAQLNSFGQLQIFPSLAPEEREFSGIYDFAEGVADHLLREYAAPYGKNLEEVEMIHVGDPAGRAKVAQSASGKKTRDAISCYQILYRGMNIYLGEDERGAPELEQLPGWGWRVIPGEVSNAKRQEAVRSRLKTLLRGGVPALIVDSREEFIPSCFLGGYRRKQYADGTYSREPEKNHASHVMDALQYLCTRLFARPAPKEDEDDYARSMPFVSQASSQYRFG